MKKLQDIPIKKKLLVVMLSTTGLALGLACFAFILHEFITARRTVVENAVTLARVLASNSTAALAFENQEDALEVLSGAGADPNVIAAALYDEDGQLFAMFSRREPMPKMPTSPAPPGYLFENAELAVYEPVRAASPLGTLYLSYDLMPLYERLGSYVLIAIVILAGSIVLAFIVSARLQKAVSRPILELAKTARSISAKRDYAVRADKFGNDELGQLTDDVNAMLAQIYQQDKELRKSEEKYRRLSRELEDRVVERTEELALANKDLEAFTFSVSHDLRAPIRHINSYSKVLVDEYAADLPPDAARYLQRIRAVSKNMGKLVDDLLNLSRVGRQPLSQQVVPLNPLLAEVIDDMKPEWADRSIEWRIGELPEAECDRGLIKQVFANLLSNAIKYTRLRDHAVIEVGHTVVNARPALFVRDNGVGFEMKYVQKLFGVFQRLHDAETFEGTGIGLALTHRIIRKHNGEIWAEGELDKGATFWFSFPGMRSMHPEKHPNESRTD